MESEPNILIDKFNQYKKYIYPIFYFCMFLFTFFISLLIIFQKLHKDNINLIYFYITFCVGLFFLLGLLAIRQDILSLVLFVIYIFYSLIYFFLVLRLDYSIYFKSMPLITAIMILGGILGLVALIILGEISFLNEIFSYFVGLNAFSLLFIIYYYLAFLNDVPTVGLDNSYSYVSFYKLYVFIMCTYYFFMYIQKTIGSISGVNIIIILMILGLILYVVRFNGKSTISLQAFLCIEYVPIFISGIICVGILIYGFRLKIMNINDEKWLYDMALLFVFLNTISLAISWFVYLYNDKPRFLSINQMVTWNFCSIFLIIVSLLINFKYSILAIVVIIIMLFLLGVILYFCNFMNLYGLMTYYSIYFLIIIIIGIFVFIYKNKINPDLIYGRELSKISFTSIFKISMVLIVVITVLSLANLSYKNVETFFLISILCGLPTLLFYLFYSSNKKATNSNFFMSCVKMLKEVISIFIKNLGSLLILFFIFIVTIICLYNVISNKYSSLDIYFLGYFFFLILYILYYFPEFVKGNFGSEKMVRQVTLINLVLFFTALIIYYILYGLGYAAQGFSNTSAQDTSYSQTLYYLILFVFLAFIYLYYRNNLSTATNPYLNLVINILFYIPCLFVNVIEYIQSQMKEKNSPYFVILFIEIVLILLYILTIYLQTKQLSQGGVSMIRNPLYLNIDTPLSVPESNLYESTKPFALSFWFYINSQSLTTNKYYNLINYQSRPQILYNPKLNSLLIDISGNTWETSYLNTYNVKNPSIEVSENITSITIPTTIKTPNHFPGVDISDNQIILDPKIQTTGVIYINKKVPLQKWNHLVVNYNGSVMDIFLNGKLVKSAPQILPNVQSFSLFDVGEQNGIDGGICNLMFYKHILTYSSVVTLYESVKDLDPPITDVYWDSTQKKVESSQLNKLKEEYKILNI